MGILDYVNKCMDEMPPAACSCGFDDVSFPHSCKEERAKRMKCNCGYYDATSPHSCKEQMESKAKDSPCEIAAPCENCNFYGYLSNHWCSEKLIAKENIKPGGLMALSEVRGMLHALSFIEEDSGKHDALQHSIGLLDSYIREQPEFAEVKQ